MTLPNNNRPPDETVMLSVRDGDVAQLGTLFDRYHRRIFTYFLRLTEDRNLSEDLLQEVFLRILKYRSTFTDTSYFKTWVYKIARNAGNDHFSRTCPDLPVDDGLLERLGPVTMPVNPAEVGQTDLLHRAIGRLPVDQREALVLARFQHMKYDEIAEVVGCAPGTVKVRVFRAMKQLQKVYFRMTGERTAWNVHK